MRRLTLLALILVLSMLLSPLLGPRGSRASAPGFGASRAAPGSPVRSSGRGAAPLAFIENVGQFSEGARFQAPHAGGTLWLAEDAIWLSVSGPAPAAGGQGESTGVNIKITFVGADARACLEPFDRLDTVVSYFMGDSPKGWHSDVPAWGGVRYAGLGPGLDLEITGEGGEWDWRLVRRDGSSAGVAFSRGEAGELALQGTGLALRVTGAESLGLDEAGRPLLSTAAGEVALPSLTSDQRGALLDDPDELLYSSYLGGEKWEGASQVHVDGSGSIYLTGFTESADFPTTEGAYDRTFADWSDVFVMKMKAIGTELIYATFVGGNDDDVAHGLAVDAEGAAYVAGETESSDFPCAPGAYDDEHSGEEDAFAIKLDPSGSILEYGTYVGGSAMDRASGIAVDGDGAVYVGGGTESAAFPVTQGAYDDAFGGETDAFVVKLNASGSDLVYATFIGGSEYDHAMGIALYDDAAYLVGDTRSGDFPTTPGALDMLCEGGEAFVAKLNDLGDTLAYSTLLGGDNWDMGTGIAVDGNGSAYVVGGTYSTDFPTSQGAYDTVYVADDDMDCYLVKFSPAGTALSYGTYLGGSGQEIARAVAVDGDGNGYVTGCTASTDFPTTAGAYDRSHGGGTCDPEGTCPDVFVARFNSDASDLSYSTYLGGGDEDEVGDIALDGSGAIYVTGETYSDDFPTTRWAYDRTLTGVMDAFVTRLAMGSGASPPATPTMTFTPVTPTATPTATQVPPTATPMPTATPSSTLTPTHTLTPSPTCTGTLRPSPTPAARLYLPIVQK